MDLLGFEETTRIARASSVRWYGRILRRNGNNVLRKALDFEVIGRRRGQPEMT